MTEFHIIGLGNLCEFVIKDIDNNRTHGVFSACSKHDRESMQGFIDYVNEIIEENEQLRKENDMFSCELSVSANKEISRNCRIAELDEENEQLKKRIAHLKNKLAYKDQHNTEKFRGIEDWAKGGF